jgi:hypothetical protein
MLLLPARKATQTRTRLPRMINSSSPRPDHFGTGQAESGNLTAPNSQH